MNYLFIAFSFFTLIIPARAAFTIATRGSAKTTILSSTNASPSEVKAAKELRETLEKISSASFELTTNATSPDKNSIIVGNGDLARQFFPEIPFDQLGPDEIVMKVKQGRLLLAGGRPRGTIYAVNRFLQEQCGVRWWTAWATNIPT